MRSKYSGKHFVRCYFGERQQCFFDGHIQAFHFFGGVFPVLIYDNLKTAVLRVLQGKNRLLQEEFKKFRSYYNFESRFCNRGRGNEKGGVEGLVGFARRNYMVPVPEADDLASLNAMLLEECLAYGRRRPSGKSECVDSLYEEEKAVLLDLPLPPFSNLTDVWCKVDKYGTVMLDKNRYSVPSRYVRAKVKVIAPVDRVEIFYGTKLIGSHE